MTSTAAVVPASSSYGSVPSSKRSGTASEDGSSLSGRTVSSSAGSADEHAEVRAEELVRRAGVEVGAEGDHVDGGVRGQVHPVDVHERAAACAAAAIAATSGRVPTRLEAPVTATTRRPVGQHALDRLDRQLAGGRGRGRPSARSRRRRGPRRTQGRMLASWSSRVTTTSSPGPHCLARARARSYVSCVIERPNTTPPGVTPRGRRRPAARRARSRRRGAHRP